MAALHRLSLAALVASLCGACSFEAATYTVDRYGGLQATQIKLGCPVPFEIYEKTATRTLLVVAHGLNESGSLCDGTPNLTPAQRARQVAEIYLTETTDRPACRLSGETAISDRHREFTYTCPAATPVPRQAPPSDIGPLFGRRTVSKSRNQP